MVYFAFQAKDRYVGLAIEVEGKKEGFAHSQPVQERKAEKIALTR